MSKPPEEERLFATPPGIALGPVDQIAEGRARSFVVRMRGGRFHGFVVRRGGNVYGYVDRCPHMGLPLAQTLDDYLAPAGDLIACSWHGALFEIESGLSKGVPCWGQRLTAWPIKVIDGVLTTAAGDENIS